MKSIGKISLKHLTRVRRRCYHYINNNADQSPTINHKLE